MKGDQLSNCCHYKSSRLVDGLIISIHSSIAAPIVKGAKQEVLL